MLLWDLVPLLQKTGLKRQGRLIFCQRTFPGREGVDKPRALLRERGLEPLGRREVQLLFSYHFRGILSVPGKAFLRQLWPEQAENFHGTGSPGGSAPVLLKENLEEPNLTRKKATGGPAHSVKPWSSCGLGADDDRAS